METEQSKDNSALLNVTVYTHTNANELNMIRVNETCDMVQWLIGNVVSSPFPILHDTNAHLLKYTYKY